MYLPELRNDKLLRKVMKSYRTHRKDYFQEFCAINWEHLFPAISNSTSIILFKHSLKLLYDLLLHLHTMFIIHSVLRRISAATLFRAK